MYPSIEIAKKELEIAGDLNPGPWTNHSSNVALARRYGTFSFTVERWNATFEIKEYFEQQMNCSIYDILLK